MQHTFHRRRGFTLIELLAVIAIILVLLTLLGPALGFVQHRAKNVKCKSNLRQLYMGMIADIQGTGVSGFRGYQDGALWMDDVSAVLGDPAQMDVLRLCPEAATLDPPGAGAGIDSHHAWHWQSTTVNDGSYGFNGWLYNPYGGTHPWTHGGAGYYFGDANWPDGFWGTPGEGGAKAPMFVDSYWVDGWPFDDDTVPYDLNTMVLSGQRPTYLARFCLARHDNGTTFGVNIVFCDGHVEFEPLDMLWDLQWNKTFKRQGKKSPFPGE